MFPLQATDFGRKYTVNLTEKECDCGCFYEYQSPCAHGIAAAMYMAEDPLSFFYDAYSTIVYRKTYSHPLPPISIENLVVDNNIKPPILRKQPGRPRAKRIRKGAWERKQTRCSSCLDWGHNKRSCRGQPVSSGRRERARNWLDEVEVSYDREEDQRTEIEDEDEDWDEDQDKEIEQEEEDQVVEEEDSELSDMTYSVIIEVLESEVIPEVMPRVVSKTATRSGRALE